MDAVSFDDLMSEAEEKYAALPLRTRDGKTVNLRSIAMLPKEGRRAADVLLKSMGAEDNDDDTDKTEKTIRDLLVVVSDDAPAMRAEVKDYPLAVLMVLVERYTGSTQVGEAAGSTD
ncbi:phage tail assembly protein [Streptomyces sp. NBC_01768]|uniref:phage tail assembly protein n=1 Tax=Streptomyces sp. NBC_01768 TaxID=2975938 RepID=UPI002DD96214|nr:phage tail assembly protein [Streptomyces sp. NBC_01768]WSC31789.1 phage tail assembly protein [Streptomyces sp. NBC_01768]